MFHGSSKGVDDKMETRGKRKYKFYSQPLQPRSRDEETREVEFYSELRVPLRPFSQNSNSSKVFCQYIPVRPDSNKLNENSASQQEDTEFVEPHSNDLPLTLAPPGNDPPPNDPFGDLSSLNEESLFELSQVHTDIDTQISIYLNDCSLPSSSISSRQLSPSLFDTPPTAKPQFLPEYAPLSTQHMDSTIRNLLLQYKEKQLMNNYVKVNENSELVINTNGELVQRKEKLISNNSNVLISKLTEILESDAPPPTTVILVHPLGIFKELSEWLPMNNVTKLEAHFHAPAMGIEEQEFDILMLPRNLNWSKSFPFLFHVSLRVPLSMHTLESAIAFRGTCSTVKILELCPKTEILLNGTLGRVFPNVETLIIKEIRNFLHVSTRIWTKFKKVQFLDMEFCIGSNLFGSKNTYPNIDMALTGMSQVEIEKILKPQLRIKIKKFFRNYEQRQNFSENARNSLLNLKVLKELKISFVDMGPRDQIEYKFVSKVTPYMIEDLRPNVSFKILVSSNIVTNIPRIIKSLRSVGINNIEKY